MGVVCTCFQVLFLNSNWVIKLVANTTPTGNKNTAIDSQELRHNCSQKPLPVYNVANVVWCTNLAIIIIKGVKKAPQITIQAAKVCRVFNHSLLKLLMNVCIML
jgi:hypothetical protein